MGPLLTDLAEDDERLTYLLERLVYAAEDLEEGRDLACALELGKLLSEVEAWKNLWEE